MFLMLSGWVRKEFSSRLDVWLTLTNRGPSMKEKELKKEHKRSTGKTRSRSRSRKRIESRFRHRSSIMSMNRSNNKIKNCCWNITEEE